MDIFETEMPVLPNGIYSILRTRASSWNPLTNVLGRPAILYVIKYHSKLRRMQHESRIINETTTKNSTIYISRTRAS